MPEQVINLIRGDKHTSDTDFSDNLPVNASGVIRQVGQSAGYMLQQPGLSLIQGSANRANLSNHSIDTGDLYPAAAGALFRLNTDGNAENSVDNGSNYTAYSNEWRLGGLSASFECRMTIVSGTFTAGTTGSWLALSSTRTWSKTVSAGAGEDTVTGTLEIRDVFTQGILDTATITLTAESTDPLDALIDALTTAGVLAKLDLLHVFAQPTQAEALVNLINPGTGDMTISGGVSFTANQGFTGNGTNGWLDSGIARTSLTTFLVNSAHIGAWVLTAPDAKYVVAINNSNASDDTTFIQPADGAGNIRARITRQSAGLELVAVASPTGHLIANRSAAASAQLYRNGASINTNTNSVAQPVSDTSNYGAFKYATNYYGGQCAIVHIGGSLSSQEVSDMYDAFETYLTAVGAIP